MDCIIYATGFRATDFMFPMEIEGRDGLTLRDAWAEGPHAHLGVTVPGFPSLFLMYGPNTNTSGGSIIFYEEAQAAYIRQALQLGALEVREDIEAASDRQLQSQFAGTAWFVLVGVVAGLVLGVLVGLLLSREELVSLAAVVVGSAAATWAMYRVGVALAPPDPAPLAARAEDGTRLLGTLGVTGASPFAALPVGALVGLVLTYLLVQRDLWRAPEHSLAWRDQTPGDEAQGEARSRVE